MKSYQFKTDTFHKFEDIMSEMLQRRAVLESVEERAIGKLAADDLVLRVWASDYLRAQLSDLRKFFERRKDSYRMMEVMDSLPTSSVVRKKYDVLKKRWDELYEEVTNSHFLHAGKNYSPPSGTPRGDLDRFIDDLNIFIVELADELNLAGSSISYHPPSADFLQEIKANAHNSIKLL